MMKKALFLLAAGMLVLLTACKDKPVGKSGESVEADSLTVGDTLTAEQEDTTLMPMFLFYHNPKNMQVVFWSELERPEKAGSDWILQDCLRRNAAKYTKLFMGYEKAQDVKFIGEQTKDPDGEPLSVFGLHHNFVPSAGLNYAFVDPDNPAGKNFEYGSMRVLTTAEFLADHKPMKLTNYDWPYDEKLKIDVVKQLEKKYGMKAKISRVACKIGDRYTYGTLQFQVKNNKALALEVLIDGEQVYDYPEEGYYEEAEGPSWNVDDEGEYIPSNILAAFEGPKGPVLCFLHGAPESTTVGLMTIKGDSLNVYEYASYYNHVDEERPVWKKDIAKMLQLYKADAPENKHYELTKLMSIDIDDDEYYEVWLRDKDDEHGALFTYRDGEVELIGVETPRLKPVFYIARNGTGYLKIAGSAGGPSYYTQVFELKKSHVVRRFNCMEVYGDIDNCEFDGKSATPEEGERYLKSLPDTRDPYIYWRDLENKDE